MIMGLWDPQAMILMGPIIDFLFIGNFKMHPPEAGN